MQIHIYRNGVEQGPYDEETVTRMLADGRLLSWDRAWHAGLDDWLPISQLMPIRPAHRIVPPIEDETTVRATPPPLPSIDGPSAAATAKQKAFLAYMGIPFHSQISREEAAALVTAAMENPAEKPRLQRWYEDRLRLHPDIFAAELRAWKEDRPRRFWEFVESVGKEVFEGVSQAHCQVLVGYLDVKFPNWDAQEHEAIWSYFFPAIAEKFPSLVKKPWRGRLSFPEGPKVARELTHDVPPLPPLRSTPHLLMRVVALSMTLTLLASAAYYVWENQSALFPWRKKAEAPAVVANPPPTPAPTPVVAAPEKPQPTPAPVPVITLATPPPAPAPATPAPAPVAAPTPAPIVAAPAPLPTPYPFQSGGVVGPGGPPRTGSLPPAPPQAQRKDTVTVLRALDVATKFGTVRIRAGTALKVVSRDGPIVNAIYMNSTVTIPISATDWR